MFNMKMRRQKPGGPAWLYEWVDVPVGASVPECEHRGLPSTGPNGRDNKVWVECEYDGSVPTAATATPDGKKVACACAGCGPKCGGYIPRGAAPMEAVAAFATGPGDSQYGVVVGSYGWPALVELQVRLIRQTCGPVPILISDDKPDTPDSAAISEACRAHSDVSHWPNEKRIGHTGGDVSVFWKGVKWGAERKLRVVAKLSQRFLVTRPRWLQDGAAELLESGLPLASRTCRGSSRFDLRTEACLLDVARWNTPDVLDRIRPRQYWTDTPQGIVAETIIHRTLVDLLGGVYWPWSLFGTERRAKADGTLWHCSHTRDDYERLAASFGITLDPSFNVEGWERDRSKGLYAYG